MGNPSSPITCILYSITLAFVLVGVTSTTTLEEWTRSLDRWFETQKAATNATLTKQQVYIHVVFDTSSPNQTIFQVASSPQITPNSPTNFGSLIALDSPFTTRSDPGSKTLGHYQGICGYADFNVVATTMNMNYIFEQGSDYEGSTLTIMGRQPVNDEVRVLSIIGGTGAFRLAKGMALASTLSTESRAQTAINMYLMYILTPAAPGWITSNGPAPVFI